MVGRAVLLRAPPPWWGVMCRCVLPPMVGGAVLARGPPHGRPCCVVVGSPSWLGVLCCCLPATVLVRGVVVLGLGCRLCRLVTGVVKFGLVVFWPAPCAACFVGSA